MTDEDLRFCPRCGTARGEGMRYCGNCGFDIARLGATSADVPPADRRVGDRLEARYREPEPRGSGGRPLLVAALIVAAGLVGYALLTRPPAGNVPAASPDGRSPGAASLAPGATPLPSAPIIALSIQSPRDGELVFTKEVTVIGLAPPGLTITRDVSLRPDQHATADSTGHWAIAVSLDQGENTLVFRIGDDRSTEQRIHVTYSPPTQ